MADLLPNHARLGDYDYPLVQVRLRAWLELEDLYIKILRAAEQRNREEFVSSLYSYVSTALFVSSDVLKNCSWIEVTKAFVDAYTVNLPSIHFPLFRKYEKTKLSNEVNGWEYPGRNWYFWLHILTSKYGWSIEYIENLSINDGIALFQEIMVDEQLDREWQWGLSEIAYPYDEITKKSKFQPLERPAWMKPVPKPLEKIKIRASQLPVGIVLKWDTDTNAYTKSE